VLKRIITRVRRVIREFIGEVRLARRVRAMKRKDPFIY